MHFFVVLGGQLGHELASRGGVSEQGSALFCFFEATRLGDDLFFEAITVDLAGGGTFRSLEIDLNRLFELQDRCFI